MQDFPGLGGFGSLDQIVSGPDAAGTGFAIDNSDDEIASAVQQLAASDTADLGGIAVSVCTVEGSVGGRKVSGLGTAAETQRRLRYNETLVAVSQAIGAPRASDRSPDQKASTTVFHRARPSRGSVNTRA